MDSQDEAQGPEILTPLGRSLLDPNEDFRSVHSNPPNKRFSALRVLTALEISDVTSEIKFKERSALGEEGGKAR